MLMNNLTPNLTEMKISFETQTQKGFIDVATYCNYVNIDSIEISLQIAMKIKSINQMSSHVCREQYFFLPFFVCKRPRRQRVYFVDCHSKGFTEIEMDRWIFQYIKEPTRSTFIRSHVHWYFSSRRWLCVLTGNNMHNDNHSRNPMHDNDMHVRKSNLVRYIWKHLLPLLNQIHPVEFVRVEKGKLKKIGKYEPNESEIIRFVPFYTLHFALCYKMLACLVSVTIFPSEITTKAIYEIPSIHVVVAFEMAIFHPSSAHRASGIGHWTPAHCK